MGIAESTEAIANEHTATAIKAPLDFRLRSIGPYKHILSIKVFSTLKLTIITC